MKIRFNRTGSERQALVRAVSKITGHASDYMGAPSFAYYIGSHTVDRDGTLIFNEQTDPTKANVLLTALAEMGFVSEDSLEPIAEDTTPCKLSIEVPLDGFDETALDNLEKLVASKVSLIKKSINAEELPIVQADDRLCFPWFSLEATGDAVDAYARFIHALCEMAKTQKRVTAQERPTKSEKYAFRCFLLRLGFIGAEFASARKILLANLSGNGSKSGEGGENNGR